MSIFRVIKKTPARNDELDALLDKLEKSFDDDEKFNIYLSQYKNLLETIKLISIYKNYEEKYYRIMGKKLDILLDKLKISFDDSEQFNLYYSKYSTFLANNYLGKYFKEYYDKLHSSLGENQTELEVLSKELNNQ